MVSDASKLAYKEKRQVNANDFENVLENGSWEKINEEEYLPESKKRVKKTGFKY